MHIAGTHLSIRPYKWIAVTPFSFAVSAIANSIASIPSTISPVSTPSDEIYGLSLFVLLITGAIFAVVSGLLVVIVIRYRARLSRYREVRPGR
jgi:heme/copper-type cytochrome/quinol oxidase subunit 2